MGRVAHTPQIPLCPHPILLKVQVVQCVAASKYPSNDVHIIEIINKKNNIYDIPQKESEFIEND